jgi:rhamnosyltransferase
MHDEVSTYRVACIIPTRNGGDDLRTLLTALACQDQPFDLFVIDSDSEDESREIALAAGADVVRINTREFDHGGTRQQMVDRLDEYDICVFLTQDAVPANKHALTQLVACFSDENIGAAYGRQLPKADATPFAAFLRTFNYPSLSRRQSLASIPFLGMKTAFISNSFAAYRREALQAVGGFPSGVILGEDVYAAARLIQAGWEIAYAAEAECLHSHNYSVWQEWQRYFDIGVFYGREAWIQHRFGSAGGEGKRFVIEELRYLYRDHKWLWPLSIARNAGKLVSYQLGKHERFLPHWLKKRLSMHRYFWQ